MLNHMCDIYTAAHDLLPLTGAFSCSRVACKAVANSKNGIKPSASLPTKDFSCPDGSVIKVMACDYGFRSGAGRLYEDHYGEVPKSIFQLVGIHTSVSIHRAARIHI